MALAERLTGPASPASRTTCRIRHRPGSGSTQARRSAAPRSGAAMPLFSQGRVAGVLLFMAGEYNVFTPEFTEILERMAENLSFALNKFDQADEKERAEQRVHFLANHDSLTGLPNRDHFNRLLEQKIKACAETQRKCAVLFIDLDRFKVINDSLGHAAGDRLLVEIANRLRACTRTNDIVARLGGDEFVVLLGDVAGPGGNHCRGQAHSCRDRAGDDACGLRVPRHRQHRRRALSRQRHRRRDADQECRYGDVRRQGRRQERRAVLLVGGKIAVGRTALAGRPPAPCARTRPVLACLPAEARCRHASLHRRGGAAALVASGARHGAAVDLHSACGGNRPDRADRPLGPEDRMRTEHAVDARRPA